MAVTRNAPADWEIADEAQEREFHRPSKLLIGRAEFM
jgi:hypothetical protein